MVKENIKSIFNEECGHLVFDVKLAKQFNSYCNDFRCKNEEHMTFFGGNLTGVQVVRFTTTDKNKWFTDILEVDDILLEERVLALPDINKDFHVSSDLFNISALWCIHMFMNTNLMSQEKKEQAMLDVALAMHYRFLTSLMYRYFKYPADPEIAAATYAQLSYKYLLKQAGSWDAALHIRCQDFLHEASIHHDALKKLDDDKDIVYVLNDAQGRIRDMLKNICAEFMRVHKEGTRISSTSGLSVFEGEEVLKDKTKNLMVYTQYLNSIIGDRNSLIKDELVLVISKILHTMPPKLLVTSLEWISVNYRTSTMIETEKLVSLTLTHSFSYLENNRTVARDTNDLPALISRLKGVYMSSRSSELDLIEMRTTAETMVRQATGVKNESVISAVRTGLLLYFIIRAFSKNHYSAK